jgi:ATP-dependent exoDNAse (exonuclease V) alpha subunit
VADRTTGQVFDYTRKSGVEHAEIVLPTEAAKRDINWPRDREQLWNAAEEAEKRKDARVAREYEVALPHELSPRERTALVREFSQEIANRYGVAVDFAIHRPHREGDERNHHAHVLTTTRQVEATGLGAKAQIEWADADRARRGLGPAKEEVAAIRERWAELTNEKLKEHGHDARVDHRSLEAQGIDREPTRHLGPALTNMQRRGLDTEVGWRVQAEARERLERAAEVGRLEREAATVERSILVLDGDIRSALQARDAQQQANVPERTPTHDRDAVRRSARERWLEHRDKQAGEGRDTGQENGTDLTRDRSKGRDTPDDDFSL